MIFYNYNNVGWMWVSKRRMKHALIYDSKLGVLDPELNKTLQQYT